MLSRGPKQRFRFSATDLLNLVGGPQDTIMTNSLNEKKLQDRNSGIFLTKKIWLLYDQRESFEIILDALREKYNIKIVSDEDDKITIILTQKNNG